MAEMIQFQCPACGTLLRLPLAMAAQQGPCPCCGRIIAAPDPYRGVGAYEPEPETTIEPALPIEPFADSPPLIPQLSTPEPPMAATHFHPPDVERHVAPLLTTGPAPSSQRAVLVLSILLTATVSLVTGYILGARANWIVSHTPFPVLVPPKAETAPPVSPPVNKVLIVPQQTETDKPPAPAPPVVEKPAVTKASAAAESALKAFLDAPDWTTRSAHVLYPEKTREAMETYSHKADDGPTRYKSISIQNSYTDKKSGNTLFIFQVVTDEHPTGIPVAVSETSGGWQVDWQSFIEFRDDLFKSFAEGPLNQTGRFHLIISAAPKAAPNAENEHFTTFLLDPPLPGRQQSVYVRKSSEILPALVAATENGAIFTPVLEVAKRGTPDGKSYLEIVRIVSTDWLPEDGI